MDDVPERLGGGGVGISTRSSESDPERGLQFEPASEPDGLRRVTGYLIPKPPSTLRRANRLLQILSAQGNGPGPSLLVVGPGLRLLDDLTLLVVRFPSTFRPDGTSDLHRTERRVRLRLPFPAAAYARAESPPIVICHKKIFDNQIMTIKS